ncbi:hypothetical protein DICVIV_04400 [Dictyocaulus viviparus]|uniref:GPAT/DHAPAT C-terminal domain-containing protein n=1 Tax=Dictyocaulus viviparus TaxID=29172 RepID=A0A0D8XXT2_DICVI|nr:hypothetical protein DICVIV_04400 [Dictyocaulus viviparus]
MFRYYINLHSNLFEFTSTRKDSFSLKCAKFPVLKKGNLKREIMEQSISHLLLATYSNTMLHSISKMGYVALSIFGRNIDNVQDLKIQYQYILKLMEREFIYVPGEEVESFQVALNLLKEADIIEISDEHIHVLKPEQLHILEQLISPCILNFQLVLEALLTANLPQYSPSSMIMVSQKENGYTLDRLAALKLLNDLSTITGSTPIKHNAKI